MFVEEAPTVPVLYSKPLARAIPILVPLALPLDEVAVSNKSICLNCVVSPLITETSGLPYKFVTLTKFPNSAVVIPALIVLKSLDLLISKSRG